MKSFAVLGAVALISSTASATFTGWTVSMATINGHDVYSVYGNFSLSTDVVLNVFDFGKAFTATGTPPANSVYTNSILAGQTGSMNATHNDNGNDGVDYFGSWAAGPGTWSGTVAAQTAMASWDSYVTMQGVSYNSTSANNWGTALDPSFIDNGSAANTSGIIGPNAGWYDATPGTTNVVGASLKFKLLQISRIAGDDSLYTSNMTMGYKAGGTTTALFGFGSFTIGIPAPGALALVGLAGLIGRRRRA